MQDPSSYVYQGRDNTGAATILRDPFADYDRARAPRKNPLLDSLGRDILTLGGKAHPKDRPALNKMTEGFVKLYSKAKADNASIDANPEIFNELITAKQALTDYTSKSIEDWKTEKAWRTQIASRPDLFEENASGSIDAWLDSGIDRSSLPPVKKKTESDFVKYFQGKGDEVYGMESYKNADGEWSSRSVFAGEKVPGAWTAIKDANMNDPKFQQFLMVAESRAKENAVLQGVDYDMLSAEEQAQLIDATALDLFTKIKKTSKSTKSAGGAAPIDKVAERAKTKAAAKKVELSKPVARIVAKPTKGGKIVKKGQGEGDDYNVGKQLLYPIVNAETGNPADNQLMIFEGGKQGRPQRIEKFEGDDPILVIATGKDDELQEVEIPLTAANRKKLETEYAFDWDVVSNDPTVKKQLDAIDWNKITEEDLKEALGKDVSPTNKARLRKAIEKRRGGKKASAQTQSAAEKYKEKYGRK